jgi:6-pyruvoyl-tetrahydropterin synthase
MSDIWQTGKLFIKDLDILDCAIFSSKHGIIGTSWHVDIEVEGSLDENGFVYDFSHTKKLVKETLKDSLDHALILPSSNSQISISEDQDSNRIEISISIEDEKWNYKAPSKSVYILDSDKVTPETVAEAAEKEVLKNLPKTVSSVKISLYEESVTDGSKIFRYTHGLPNHKGLCQRLFHGHRSKIVILKDNSKSEELESLVAEKWFHSQIHIAEPGQFKSTSWQPYSVGKNGEYSTLSYTAQEGYFEATIPSHKIYIVEQATSIESIAQGLCKQLKALNPDSSITVMPHEGINKGGIASL